MSLHRSIGVIFIALAAGCDASGMGQQPSATVLDAARRTMLEEHLRARDITNVRVLEAMARIPRHEFVPEPYRERAYIDAPLPIGEGQTISQPYIVAFMTQALDVRPDHRVLEIGTGSGYQAAVLASLARVVYTIEILPSLAARARDTLRRLGFENVQVLTGNGYLGWR